MTVDFAQFLKHKLVNTWGLFLLLSVPMCFFNVITMLDTDMSSPEGVSYMIGYSVRWAIPFIYLVVAASSIRYLFSGPLPIWWMRNRKYIGLVFAVAMAWQALFIFILSTVYRDYYFDQVFYFRDELEGSVGYIFLVGMVVTSFQFARKKVNQAQWKLIQKGGVYFLWAYAFSVYWWNLFYYPYFEGFYYPETHDYLFYWAGFIVFVARIAAWGKMRNQAVAKDNALRPASSISVLLGSLVIALGLVASATGHYWFEFVSSVVSGPLWSQEMTLWLPFWPFEPFMPLFIIGLGTMLITSGRRNQSASVAAT